MQTYPADERRIADVERGRSSEAVVPLPPGEMLAAGDSVLFAHSRSRPGQPPGYVPGGDSVLVALTGVTDLGQTDPATGHPLVHLRWSPLGQNEPALTASRRRVRPTRPGPAT